MSELTCPFHDVALPGPDENGDMPCPECGRVWFLAGGLDAGLRTRPTRVRLAKELEVGQRYDETVIPLRVRSDAEVRVELVNQIQALQAENQRLREALREGAEMIDGVVELWLPWPNTSKMLTEWARKAREAGR